MDSQICWWFIILFLKTIQTRNLFNESTNKKQTPTLSTNNSVQYQSNYSTSLAKITTTIRSSNTIQSFITKPNSYIYNPDDDEFILDRVKREPAPFVCKSKISFFFNVDIFNKFSSRWLFSRSTKLSNLSYMYIRC
jgi:hypothetical protein